MSNPSLLIAEPPLQVLPSLAKAIGLNEAIVLQQIQYWTALEQGEEREGRRWIYNSVEQWRKQFPFWSDNTIQRTLQSLRDKELVDAKKLAADKWKHTLYYAINYNKLQEYITPNWGKGICKNAESITPDCDGGNTPDCGSALPQNGVIIHTENTQRLPETSLPLTPSADTKHEEKNAIATGKDLGFQPSAFADDELVSEPLPRTVAPRTPQPFQTTSQTQEQSKRRAQVFGWIYSAVHGQELQTSPAPGTLKKYAEALDWFLSASITAEQICRAAAAAKTQWRNLDNVKQAINPRSLADNWHTLYTPPKPSTAPRSTAPQFDLSKPLMGLSRKAFIDHFAHTTQIQRWEIFEAWAKERPTMLDHALYARELANAVEKAVTFGKDRYAVEPDPKGLEIEF